jgi:hypothetical protein
MTRLSSLALTLVLSAPALAQDGPEDLVGLAFPDLLACARGEGGCAALDWDLARRIATVAPASQRIRALDGARDPREERVLLLSLYGEPGRRVDAAMRRALAGDLDSDTRYHALAHLARSCDPAALAEIVTPPVEPRASCEQWAYTVRDVARCDPPGAEAFLRASLRHACLDVVEAAEEGLREHLPGGAGGRRPSAQRTEAKTSP